MLDLDLDLDVVRAAIKAWERDFASRHGRDPSVQDIRDHPDVADKYRLYKKLSRAASALPPHKARPAHPAPPPAAFNPFSPANKSATRNLPNPFATPTKNTSRPPPLIATPPSPRPSALYSASSPRGLPVATTAVSRARKRLRGEPVSPSPSKPKRQRIRSQPPPPIPKSDHDSSNSELEADHELPQYELVPSFVEDSPEKAPAGRKPFKLLFDDALPALSIPKKFPGPSVALLGSPHASSSQRALPTFFQLQDLKLKEIASLSEHRVNRTQGKIPAKDHLPHPSHKPAFKSLLSHDSRQKPSTKRGLDGGDHEPQHTASAVPLIPPSPPPQGSTGTAMAKTTGRKKLRVDDEESDEEVDGSNITFKVATTSLNRQMQSYRHADELDWDPLLYVGTRNHDPDANHHASGTLSVNLPDKFRCMLAISPSRSQNSSEERVVRGLLYGDRAGHYDPSRGGNVWDVGETDEGAPGDTETEDDWEGEPVSWDVGEL